MKRRIAIPMQVAEDMPIKETCLGVRGSDITMPMGVVIIEKVFV